MVRALLTVAVVAVLAIAAQAEHAFPVHRLAQFDVEGESKGSRSAAVDLLATAVNPDGSGGSARVLNRRVAVVRMEDVTPELLKTVIFDRKAGGVLILLPSDPKADVSGFRDIELELLDTEIPAPLYFAFMDERLEGMYETLQQSLAGSDLSARDSFQLTVAAKKVAPVANMNLQNLQAWLPAAGSDEDVDADEEAGAPTIAVVAHYDSFSVAPSMPTGVDSNGSGATTLLELARLFSVLYDSARTQGGYNLLFVLTAGGHFNFRGAESWIENLDEDTSASISFVLCLDSLASGDALYLHSAKKRTANSMKGVVEALEGAAQERSVTLNVVHKKVNLANPVLAWEHEVFQKRRIPAATLSALAAPRPGFERSRLFDNSARASTKVLTRNVRLVADAMGRLVYGLDAPIFQGGLAVDAAGVRAWSALFGREPRSPASLAEGGTKVVDGMFERLSSVAEATRQSFAVEEGELMFYTPAALTMTSYSVKPISFDVYFMLAVFAYCAVVYVVCQGREGLATMFPKPKSS